MGSLLLQRLTTVWSNLGARWDRGGNCPGHVAGNVSEPSRNVMTSTPKNGVCKAKSIINECHSRPLQGHRRRKPKERSPPILLRPRGRRMLMFYRWHRLTLSRSVHGSKSLDESARG